MTKWGSEALLVTPKLGGGRGSLVLRLSMRLSLYLLVGPPAKGLLAMLKNTNLRTQKKKRLGLMLEGLPPSPHRLPKEHQMVCYKQSTATVSHAQPQM